MKKSHVLNCSFSNWYPTFKDSTIVSQILKLPAEFLEYLHADGVVLPESTINSTSNEDAQSNTEEEDAGKCLPPTFPEFEAKLKKCIKELGGKVFPKLNWSAPRDATWISFDNTLKCTCASDVYLLLKSSDFIAHDLTQPFIKCEDYSEGEQSTIEYELVLRKWRSIHAANEFRCFVRNNKLIGISQRYHSAYFVYIQQSRRDIIKDVLAFHEYVIQDKFPDSNYVFDVHRENNGRMLLLDFNPFGEVTDGLLFTWSEIQSGTKLLGTDEYGKETVDEVPAFRYVTSEATIMHNPYAQYAIPKDFVDLTSGEDASKLLDLLKMKIQRDDSSSEDDDTKPTDSTGVQSKIVSSNELTTDTTQGDLSSIASNDIRLPNTVQDRPSNIVRDTYGEQCNVVADKTEQSEIIMQDSQTEEGQTRTDNDIYSTDPT